MRLTLRQLHIFTAVADTGSTTAAGLHVALSQSATSAALHELERLLDAQLFDRIGKRLLLNDNGRALLPQARVLLDAAQDIEEQFRHNLTSGNVNMPATRLRIGASTTIGSYLLPGLLARYQQAWPSVAVDVHIGNTREVALWVARLDVDMGLIEGPCHESELLVQVWQEDELVVVCAAKHPLREQGERLRVSVKDLRQARGLLREPGSGTREAVEHALLPHLNHFNSEMQLGSTEAIKQAAAEGLGLACLSLCAVQDLITLGRLVVLNTTLPRLKRHFYLIRHRHKHFSANLERFAAHCVAIERRL